MNEDSILNPSVAFQASAEKDPQADDLVAAIVKSIDLLTGVGQALPLCAKRRRATNDLHVLLRHRTRSISRPRLRRFPSEEAGSMAIGLPKGTASREDRHWPRSVIPPDRSISKIAARGRVDPCRIARAARETGLLPGSASSAATNSGEASPRGCGRPARHSVRAGSRR